MLSFKSFICSLLKGTKAVETSPNLSELLLIHAALLPGLPLPHSCAPLSGLPAPRRRPPGRKCARLLITASRIHPRGSESGSAG